MDHCEDKQNLVDKQMYSNATKSEIAVTDVRLFAISHSRYGFYEFRAIEYEGEVTGMCKKRDAARMLLSLDQVQCYEGMLLRGVDSLGEARGFDGFGVRVVWVLLV